MYHDLTTAMHELTVTERIFCKPLFILYSMYSRLSIVRSGFLHDIAELPSIKIPPIRVIPWTLPKVCIIIEA